MRFDVVGVGGGNAALVAALSAHEAGARVAVLEASPIEERGGNSRFSGSIFRIVHGGMDDVKKLLHPEAHALTDRCSLKPYTKDDYLRDITRTSQGRFDRCQAEVVIDHSYQTANWMKDRGVHWQLSFKKFFDEDKMTEDVVDIPPGVGMMAKDQGQGLMSDLWNAVEKTDIRVFYNCPGYDLVADGDCISGVKARMRDSYAVFYGQVILACGGFEANPRPPRQYLGEGWDLVLVRGTRFNTGTILEKALALGAQACGHWGSAHATPQDINPKRSAGDPYAMS